MSSFTVCTDMYHIFGSNWKTPFLFKILQKYREKNLIQSNKVLFLLLTFQIIQAIHFIHYRR